MPKIELTEKFKNLKIGNFIFAMIFIVFIASIGGAVFFSVKLLINQIELVTAADTDSSAAPSLGLDINAYNKLAKKLGLTMISTSTLPQAAPETELVPTTIEQVSNIMASTTDSSQATSSTQTEIVTADNGPASSSATEIIAAEKQISEADRALLSLAVYNTTKTNGLAAELKKLIEAGSYKVATTGSKPPTIEQTIIRIKNKYADSKFTQEIKQLVGTKYQVELKLIEDSSSAFDFEILIGNK